MTRENRIEQHKKLAESQQEKAAKYKKQLNANSIFRLAVFLCGAVLVYLFHRNTPAVVLAATGTIAAFAALLTRHKKLSESRAKAETLVKIAKNELRAFNHDFSAFDGAPERINPEHDFSFDLDIFGEKSVFQQLNRASLSLGKETLADMVEKPLENSAEIELKQHAVKELSEKEDFCLQFRTIGMLSDDKLLNNNAIEQLSEAKPQFRQPLFWRIALFAVPALYAALIALAVAGIISGGIITLLYLITLALSSVPMKKVKRTWLLFDKKVNLLESYSDLLTLLESETFVSERLKSLQQSIRRENLSASTAIKQLAQYSQNLNLAFAVPVFLILNPVFLWNVLYALKIEKWMQKNASEIEIWFSVLAKTDALISLGTFAANNPDYAFPRFDNTRCLEAKKMGHPLLPREKCVRNNIEIVRKPFFMIVTGANMAGKSTYLRTVGVNHLFACIGLPVCAESMTLRPTRLLTNLRTADSLVNSESYFFAELKRLKMIIDQLESREKEVFIILDEILKGTNSEDKQKGSFSLMKRLVKLEANGIIATHDLALGKLEDEFPLDIHNFHFDANIENDVLSFDYKLRRGIAQNMNASYLMKSMGIA